MKVIVGLELLIQLLVFLAEQRRYLVLVIHLSRYCLDNLKTKRTTKSKDAELLRHAGVEA